MDIVTIIGTVASVLGLGVSLLAMFFAKSASERAREARDAVERHHLESALREAANRARQLVDAIRARRQLQICREELEQVPTTPLTSEEQKTLLRLTSAAQAILEGEHGKTSAIIARKGV